VDACDLGRPCFQRSSRSAGVSSLAARSRRQT
jgi:hypothetical protein